MRAIIHIHVSSDDPEAPLMEFIAALENLLAWQWNNVALSSEVIHDEPERI